MTLLSYGDRCSFQNCSSRERWWLKDRKSYQRVRIKLFQVQKTIERKFSNESIPKNCNGGLILMLKRFVDQIWFCGQPNPWIVPSLDGPIPTNAIIRTTIPIWTAWEAQPAYDGYPMTAGASSPKPRSNNENNSNRVGKILTKHSAPSQSPPNKSKKPPIWVVPSSVDSFSIHASFVLSHRCGVK